MADPGVISDPHPQIDFLGGRGMKYSPAGHHTLEYLINNPNPYSCNNKNIPLNLYVHHFSITFCVFSKFAFMCVVRFDVKE